MLRFRLQNSYLIQFFREKIPYSHHNFQKNSKPALDNGNIPLNLSIPTIFPTQKLRFLHYPTYKPPFSMYL